VLGEVVLGDVVLEPDELPLMPEELLVPPLELEFEPDLLKYASHSERETWPSLFVSAAEKFGVERLLELPLEVDGEEGALLGDDEDCATASVENAKSTAAAVAERGLSIGWTPLE
jgi:hypothetical protein